MTHPITPYDLTQALIAHLHKIGGEEFSNNVEFFKIGVIAEALRRHGINAVELRGKSIALHGKVGDTTPELFGVRVGEHVFGSYGDVGWTKLNQRLAKKHHLHAQEGFEVFGTSGAKKALDYYPPNTSLAHDVERLAQQGAAWLNAYVIEQATRAAGGAIKAGARL